MSVYLLDIFNGTTGTPLSLNTMDVGPGWTALSGGQFVIQSNAAYQGTALGVAGNYADAGVATLRIVTNGLAVPSNAHPGANYSFNYIVRMVDTANYLAVAVQCDNETTARMDISTVIAGVSVELVSVNLPSNPRGTTINPVVIASGTNVSITIGATTASVNTSQFLSATKVGFFDYIDGGSYLGPWILDDIGVIGLTPEAITITEAVPGGAISWDVPTIDPIIDHYQLIVNDIAQGTFVTGSADPATVLGDVITIEGRLADETVVARGSVTLAEPLIAGILSVVSITATTATLNWSNASGGIGSVDAQLQRSAHGANTWSDVAGAITSPATNTGLTTGTTYDYRVAFADDATTVYSNTVSVLAINAVGAGPPASAHVSVPQYGPSLFRRRARRLIAQRYKKGMLDGLLDN